MKERPIIFSAPMVRAILEGKKTQTRRVINFPDWWGGHFNYSKNETQLISRDGDKILSCPYGQPDPYGDYGDQLYVRESFYIDLVPYDRGPLPKESPGISGSLYYRADGECCEQIPECCCNEVGPCPWRPSIHMPKWAARIWLEVTGIRVERVQDISADDIRAEGTPGTPHSGNCLIAERESFVELWDSINLKRGYGWDANPWVWVVEFKRIEK